MALVPSLSGSDKFVESNTVHSATRRTLRQDPGSVLNHHQVSFQRPLIDRGSFKEVKCVEEGRGKRERSVCCMGMSVSKSGKVSYRKGG